MLEIDDIDRINIASEYGDEKILELDYSNANEIYSYLLEQGIDYAHDLLITDFNLYLLEYDTFKAKFEKLKEKLGMNYIEILNDDENDYWLEMYN